MDAQHESAEVRLLARPDTLDLSPEEETDLLQDDEDDDSEEDEEVPVEVKLEVDDDNDDEGSEREEQTPRFV